MCVLEKGLFWLFVVLSLESIILQSATTEELCVEADDQCSDTHVQFYLYTMLNKENPIKISKETDFKEIQFSETEHLKIMIHGIGGSYNDDFNTSIRNAYFEQGLEYNIISVNYYDLKPIIECYEKTVKNVVPIANCIAQLLSNILDVKKTQFTYVHAIGFCVGAQIVGYTAKLLKDMKITFQRATGLDPALRNFELIFNFLDKESADFVDIIHTNCGFFGQLMPAGSVDFYANGGINQPGCPNNTHDWKTCSHNRAYEYFAESILYKLNETAFFANKHCSIDQLSLTGGFKDSEIVLVGAFCNPQTVGIFGFPTKSSAPYVVENSKILKELLENTAQDNV
ncbi:Triacylglycerol lipase family,Lipase/vitellogenin,Alpha/Beta hydrolase fold [Cinara cedri]|uniref:Triacylglycerol lipase family,Lipase/vitellogenin,Alpha/Beta hydrolase fold n=1 Tax=Cinara cedri TaxID=506608 RepID=A0A5E4NAW0_9HEMI|nr:Triacylglycerol lipase family,Lipase/vitellogenin,Alpha/Beta hydrolase fold [Cinara cedri]